MHVFTHFTLTLDVWRAELATVPLNDGKFVAPAELAAAALPTLMKKAIQLAEPGAFAPAASLKRKHSA